MAAPGPEIKAVSDANTQFSANLHNALKQNIKGNLIYSPISLSSVIAMAKIGAKGSTADEITTSLKFPPTNEILTIGYSKVLSSLQVITRNQSRRGYVAGNTDGISLSVANRLFMKSGFDIIHEFQNVLKNSFKAEAKQLDFSKKTESAVEINTWVEKSTHNKIKDLISPDVLSEATNIILVNAIYFKGQWAEKFDPAKTSKQPFYVSETKEVQVDMMKSQDKLPYAEIPDIGAQAVVLPYKGNRLCMLIIVPKEKSGLSKIEAGFKHCTPATIFSKLGTHALVNLMLPKFRLESTLRLVETLKKFGMNSMFGTSADFSGITKQISLCVSEVVQKAFIEVNEEGSEAAAATAMMVTGRSMPTFVDVKANRPFLFQIIDKNTELILFSGVCANPLGI